MLICARNEGNSRRADGCMHQLYWQGALGRHPATACWRQPDRAPADQTHAAVITPYDMVRLRHGMREVQSYIGAAACRCAQWPQGCRHQRASGRQHRDAGGVRKRQVTRSGVRMCRDLFEASCSYARAAACERLPAMLCKLKASRSCTSEGACLHRRLWGGAHHRQYSWDSPERPWTPSSGRRVRLVQQRDT